jgi:hypothetical protein
MRYLGWIALRGVLLWLAVGAYLAGAWVLETARLLADVRDADLPGVLVDGVYVVGNALFGIGPFAAGLLLAAATAGLVLARCFRRDPFALARPLAWLTATVGSAVFVGVSVWIGYADDFLSDRLTVALVGALLGGLVAFFLYLLADLSAERVAQLIKGSRP